MFYRTKSLMLRRVSASAHNCAAIIVGSLPLLPLLGKDGWRYALVAICFVYHLWFRRGCLGNFVCGLINSKPIGPMYAALYSAGFATIFYSVAVPFDLLALYVFCQWVCLRATGHTIPGYITQWRPTMTDIKDLKEGDFAEIKITSNVVSREAADALLRDYPNLAPLTVGRPEHAEHETLLVDEWGRYVIVTNAMRRQ